MSNQVKLTVNNVAPKTVTSKTKVVPKERKTTSKGDELRYRLWLTKAHDGWIGKSWNWVKNTTGFGAGSEKAEEAIKRFERGEISEKEALDAVDKYSEGQKLSVDITADIASGAAAFGTFVATTSTGIAAAPFTGGASLGLVATGFAAAGASGAATKAGIKAIDAKTGGREYDSIGYDFTTGGVNGLFAPITAGVGGVTGKTVAAKVGVTAVNVGSKTPVKASIEGTVKASLTRATLNTNVQYTGGTLATRSLAYGSDMAVNGAISGSVDNGVRYLAGDTENKTLNGLLSEVGVGAVGGFVLAPVIGGGAKLTGNGIQAASRRITAPITDNFKVAQSNMQQELRVSQSREFGAYVSFLKLWQTPDDRICVADWKAATDKIPESGVAYFAQTRPPQTIKNPIFDPNARVSSLADLGITPDLVKENAEHFTTLLPDSKVRTPLSESYSIVQSRLKYIDSLDLPPEDKEKAMKEALNIWLSKFGQTYSVDPALKQYPALEQGLKSLTSDCWVTRTLEQAQNFANEIYGEGAYTIRRSFGAGTIGETYLASTTDGREVVIKMLKTNITPKRIKEDEKIFMTLIDEFIADPKLKEYYRKLAPALFKAWCDETNYELEAKGALALAQNAKKYKVAKILKVGVDKKSGHAVSLVMEKAQGVPLDKLLKMLDAYNNNPVQYMDDYAEDIALFPALANPEKWKKSLGSVYQSAMNEQCLTPRSSSIIHGDPHSGNIFVNFNEQMQPNITFIDTGNVVSRDFNAIRNDLLLSANLMLGNAEGVADLLLKGAELPESATLSEIRPKVIKLLNERLFETKANLTDMDKNNKVISGIMEELYIVQNPELANVMKAAVQRFSTLSAINRTCGTSYDSAADIRALFLGLAKSVEKDPKATSKELCPVFQYIYNNYPKALQTFGQFYLGVGQ